MNGTGDGGVNRTEPKDRVWFADPHNRIGSVLWKMSNYPGGEWGAFIGVGAFLSIFILAGKFLQKGPIASALVIAGFVVLFLGVIVGQMAGEQLCPECGTSVLKTDNYCSHCGAEVSTDD